MGEPFFEPPVAGDEYGALFGALERQRATFRYKCDDLDEAGLRAKLATSTLSLGGLLVHLALVEEYTVGVKIEGGRLSARWSVLSEDEGEGAEFQWAETASAREIYNLYDEVVAECRRRLERVAAGGLDQLVVAAWPDGRRANVRRIVTDLLEEYARHTGHADLLREAVDGRVGEDPPATWTWPTR